VFWDLYAVPAHFETALIWRLVTVAPLTWIGLSLLKQDKIAATKLVMGASIISLAMIAMYLSTFGTEAIAARYAMAAAFLVSIACFALPFTPSESRVFALSYVLLTTLAALWPNPLQPVDAVLHMLLTAMMAGTSLALARKHWDVDARNFLLDLREEATREELEHNNELLRQLSEQDPLTGLPNRRYFERVLAERMGAIPQQAIGTSRMALMMIDLDHFKNFNDRHGHQAGDRCLTLAAQQLQSVFPSEFGVLARYGGEEFIAAFREREPGQAERLAEEMRLAIAGLLIPVRDDAAPLITTSIGVALAPSSNTLHIEDLIEMADVALYSAKNAGRNRVETIEASDWLRKSA
jgi:diguanylate cyclase (GGDEF)-like protein